MEESRIKVIAALTERRIKHLEALAMSKTHRQIITNEDDVEHDIAADYQKQ